MSRKHFRAIASAFAATRPDLTQRKERLQWNTDVLSVAVSLGALNPNFNRDTFIEACGE